MNRFPFLCALALLAAGSERGFARGQAEHVVVVVWDGLQPDFVTPQYTPTLYELAKKGTFFANNHSSYITSTEVNGAALATGMLPDHNGIMANSEYRADVNWLAPFATEALEVVRRTDAATHGHYLEAATVAEILQEAGHSTIIAGTKPVALLHDRSGKKISQSQKILSRSLRDSPCRAPSPKRSSTRWKLGRSPPIVRRLSLRPRMRRQRLPLPRAAASRPRPIRGRPRR